MTFDLESAPAGILLTPEEARVIGCLMEKQRTTPDQYPLTLNSLLSACNQKSARSPVMRLTQGEVGHLLNQLRDKGLIHASFTGRTERYDHKIVGAFFLSREEQALLCALLLRGPQTPGELRINSARMADFADLESVMTALRAMMDREHPLVTELPRLPGKREERYAHLLCGKPSGDELQQPGLSPESARDADLEAQVATLQHEVEALRAELDLLWRLTGLEAQRRP